MKIATCGAPRPRGRAGSAERGVEQFFVDGSGTESLACLDRRHDRLGGREQARVDLVEVALIRFENFRERPTVVARVGARQLFGQRLGRLGRAAHEEMSAAGIDDRVIGAAHGRDEIGMRRRQRRRGDAVDDMLERELQLMRLVQRHLEHAADHLHAAGEALRRRIDEGELVGRDAAIIGDLGDDGLRRRRAGLEHDGRAIGGILVRQLLEQRLLAGQRAAGAGAEREEFLVGEAPAGILAGEAGHDRVVAGDGEPERPVRLARSRRQRDLAEAAEADFGEQQAGVDAARDLGAGVDQQLAEAAARNGDPIALGAGGEPIDDLARQQIDAGRGPAGLIESSRHVSRSSVAFRPAPPRRPRLPAATLLSFRSRAKARGVRAEKTPPAAAPLAFGAASEREAVPGSGARSEPRSPAVSVRPPHKRSAEPAAYGVDDVERNSPPRQRRPTHGMARCDEARRRSENFVKMIKRFVLRPGLRRSRRRAAAQSSVSDANVLMLTFLCTIRRCLP